MWLLENYFLKINYLDETSKFLYIAYSQNKSYIIISRKMRKYWKKIEAISILILYIYFISQKTYIIFNKSKSP